MDYFSILLRFYKILYWYISMCLMYRVKYWLNPAVVPAGVYIYTAYFINVTRLLKETGYSPLEPR